MNITKQKEIHRQNKLVVISEERGRGRDMIGEGE